LAQRKKKKRSKRKPIENASESSDSSDGNELEFFANPAALKKKLTESPSSAVPSHVFNFYQDTQIGIARCAFAVRDPIF
jgi:hypothetical protein